MRVRGSRQNIGIVCQLEGEAAREQGNEPAARLSFHAAQRSVEESLRIRSALANEVDETALLSQIVSQIAQSTLVRWNRPAHSRGSVGWMR